MKNASGALVMRHVPFSNLRRHHVMVMGALHWTMKKMCQDL